MANSELSVNDQIAAAFREINTDWRVFDRVSSENTEAILKKKALRPDILILEPGVPPICLETEFEPANSVEADAASRLGEISTKTGGTIQVVLALVIPKQFKDISATKLLGELRSATDFRYCVLMGLSVTHYERWPAKGFLRGSLRNLFTTIQGAATPPSFIQKGADALELGAAEIAASLNSLTTTHAGVVAKVSATLKQEANLQTFRMAATILINAFVFQENLAGRSGGLEDVKSLEEMKNGSQLSKASVITEWSKILKINYWPIFGIARSVLEVVPANVASDILIKMHSTASILLTLNLGKNSDLSGVIFQRLISDRRFLATFYTTPASAALLNGLVFREDMAPNNLPWTKEEAPNLRIADFACGTGLRNPPFRERPNFDAFLAVIRATEGLRSHIEHGTTCFSTIRRPKLALQELVIRNSSQRSANLQLHFGLQKNEGIAEGTGSLLCGAYSEVRRHLETNGVSARKLHASFIEHSLVGCDVLPSATHITASMLSSAFPEQRYKRTKVLTLPFGRQVDGSVSLGAIEFLSTQGALSIIETGAKGVGAVGETEIDPWEVLGGSGVADDSFDVVVINPPFTRLTGGGGKTSEVPRPMFAAFGTEEEEQKLMSERAKKLTQGTAAHGNAGEASIFLQISHNKVKDGGYIALVLPITFLSGIAWGACRELIRKNYGKIIIVTIASSSSGSFAFSADANTGECLVVAKKGGGPAKRLSSISLTAKPSTPFEGTEVARLIREAVADDALATLEGGPLGGTPLELGAIRIGEMISGAVGPNEQWPLFRVADHCVAQVAYQLVSKFTLWLPGVSKGEKRPIPLCRFEELGDVGPYHLDIDGSAMSGGAARGPFKIRTIKTGHAATFPILDGHDAEQERTLEITYDCEGIARTSKSQAESDILEQRRNNLWATRSRLHLNTDFRFNSQSLAFAITSEECMGGRAWPTFKMKVIDHDIIASLWYNSTLGLLSYWWGANKSQDGRGSITTTQMPKLSVLDPRKLEPLQIEEAKTFFDANKYVTMLPAHQIGVDTARANLDLFVLNKLLRVSNLQGNLKAMAVLRRKLGDEPSFNGGK